MIQVTLEKESWDRVLAILSQAPWNVANPLIMAIGEQVRVAVMPPAGAPTQGNNHDLDAAVAGLSGKPQ